MSWRRFLQRSQWDRERLEEIESYVRIETDENIARGMPYAQAVAMARRKFGNPTRVREEIYPSCRHAAGRMVGEFEPAGRVGADHARDL